MELVLRFNPGSEAVADPAIRDVVAAVMLLGIAYFFIPALWVVEHFNLLEHDEFSVRSHFIVY